MTSGDNPQGRAAFYGSLATGPEFYRRAGARLAEPVSEDALEHFERGFNPSAHRAFHRFDKAHQLMLAEEGIVPLEAATANLRQLREMEADGEIEIRQESGRHCHAGEAYLIEHLGEETAGWLHVGRSTGDLMAVARRFVARDLLLETMDRCLDLMAAYCTAAEEFKGAIMPNYTIFQQAQVGTFGWYLIGWERSVERAYRRFADSYDRVNRSPAGFAAGTTTDFRLDRERTAELLGFDGLLDNAEDGLHASFDLWLEAQSAVTTLSTSIAFAADHLFLWNTREYDLVDLPDRFFGTSSIMPHKRNAYVIQDVQNDGTPAIGRLMESFVQSRNISSNPGVSVDAFEGVAEQIDTWEKVLRNLEFDYELAEERVYLDWALSADLAAELVRRKGIPWRWAHQITAILVRRSIEAGRDIREVTPEHVEEAAIEYLGEPLSLEQSMIDEIVDAERALEARSHLRGSPAVSQVQAQIERSRKRLDAWRADLDERNGRLAEADRKLEEAIDALLEPDETD